MFITRRKEEEKKNKLGDFKIVYKNRQELYKKLWYF